MQDVRRSSLAGPTARARVSLEPLEPRVLLSAGASLDALAAAGQVQALTWQGRTAYAVPGRWILGVSAAEGAVLNGEGRLGGSLAAAAGAGGSATEADAAGQITLEMSLGGEGVFRVEAPASLGYEQVLAAARTLPGFQYIEPDFVVTAATTMPDDPQFASLYGLNNTGQSGGTADADIDAPEAWDITTGTGTVVVGVIDTGVDYTHQDLAGNIWTNAGEVAGNGIDDDANGFVDDVHGYNFVANTGDPMDDHFHGTHVSGTIGAVGDNGAGVAGVDWNVRIMALKFLDSTASGSTSNAILAINYAIAMRQRGVNIRVLSNSWGGGGYSAALESAIRRAGAAGMLFVAAAGNDGVEIGPGDYYPACYDSDNVISVAATDRRDALAAFSNRGAVAVDLGAPGVDVNSTLPGNAYGTLSGTSMATPYVAGVAALAFDANPAATMQEIRDAILGGVDPIPSLAGNTVTGGRLNARNTLALLGLTVDSCTPAPGGTVAVPPVDFTVRFSEAYDPATAAAADFRVNSVPAGSCTLVDATTIRFHFNASPVTGQGAQTMSMPAGALARLRDGWPSVVWTAAFRYDAVTMAVASTTPASGAIPALPVTNVRVVFNEAYDPATLATGNLRLGRGTVTAATVVNATTADYTVSGITAEGTVTMAMAAGAMTDVYGNAMAAFSGTFEPDNGVLAYPVPLAAVGPAGSLVYDPFVTGTIASSVDTDAFTIALDPGQTLTVTVEAAAGLLATVSLRDASGTTLASAAAGTAGKDALLQTAPIAAGGTYTVVVGGGAGTLGAYTMRVILNAAVEGESHDGAANDTAATAQDIEGSFLALGGGPGQRGAVMGAAAAGDHDYYRFSLAAGQSATLAAATSSGASLALYNAAGALLASGAGPYDNVATAIRDFRATAAGLYYVRVDSQQDYCLVVTRGATFDIEPNDTPAAAQPLGPGGRVLGYAGVGMAAGKKMGLIQDSLPWGSASNTTVAAELGYTVTLIPSSSLSTANLLQYNVVMLAGDQSATTYINVQNNMGRIESYVSAGGAWVASYAAGSVLTPVAYDLMPDAGGITFVAGTGSSIDVVAPDTALVNGPGGVITDSTLDGGTSSYHAHTTSSLPPGAAALLSTANHTQIVAFDYAYGTGHVVIHAIPMEYYGGTGNFGIFQRNLLAFGPAAFVNSDNYSLTLHAGLPVTISTATPGDGAREPGNALDPRVEVYDPSGALAASAENGAADGRNVSLLFTPALTGTYVIKVAAAANRGEYVLNVAAPIPSAPVPAPLPPLSAGTSRTLTWSPVAAADDYFVEFDDDPSFATPNGNSGWTTATTATLTGLAGGITYYYRVKASGLSGAGAWSASVFSTQDATPPTVPGALTATPLSVSAIQLNWSPAADPECGIASYNVYRDGVLVASTGPAQTAFTDPGLGEATNHSYRVSAVNGLGVEGPAAGPVAAATLRDTLRPTILSALWRWEDSLQVVFSEPVEAASAQLAANYAITCSNQYVKVLSAVLRSDSVTVDLVTTDMDPVRTYSLAVSNVRDRAVIPNTIAANTTAALAYGGLPGLDVGAAAVPGSHAYSPAASGTYTISASGAGLDGTADGFYYAWRILPVDGDITVRVVSLPAGAKAGAMIRSALTADSPYIGVFLEAGGSTDFQYRTVAGGNTTTISTGGTPAPYYLRLTSASSVEDGFRYVTASVKPTGGSSWMGLAYVELPLNSDPYYIGIAATSASAAAGAFTLSNVSVTTSAPLPNAAPAGSGDAYSTAWNTTLSVPCTGGLLVNDTDSDGNSLSASLATAPAHGAVTVQGNGAFTYTPTPGYSGPDSFVYTLDDGHGLTRTATAALLVRDTVPPVVTVNSKTTGDTTPSLAGTVDDPAATVSVTVGGHTYTALNNGNGTWTLGDNAISPALGRGVYNVQATATDAFANAASDATADELIVYTLMADANLDGTVDLQDFSLLKAYYNQTGQTWGHGDFNGDAVVDLQDFSLMTAFYNRTVPIAPAPSPAVEPAPPAYSPTSVAAAPDSDARSLWDALESLLPPLDLAAPSWV